MWYRTGGHVSAGEGQCLQLGRRSRAGSFATDYAGVSDDIERADLSITTFDLYSVFLGTEFAVELARVTLGAGYGWASAPADRITDLIRDEDFEANYVYKRFRVLFGFELITN